MLKIENKADIFHYRTLLFILIFSILTLLSRYFYLQVIEHERYSSKSQVNSIRAQATYAPRGLDALMNKSKLSSPKLLIQISVVTSILLYSFIVSPFLLINHIIFPPCRSGRLEEYLISLKMFDNYSNL